ncbi:MAG: PilZ domain-containing protein [Bdellovibrionales bacterium]|nr:PilZ domain-containing protein [Bdellovibrionales bacterium]
MNDSRYPMDFPVIIRTPAGSRVSAVTLNMSRTGVGLRIPDSAALQPGDPVVLQLHVPGAAASAEGGFGSEESAEEKEPYELQGEVIWRARSRCGVRILGGSERVMMLYESLLDGYRVLQEFNVSL